MSKLITKDSRLVEPGSIYCCFPGQHVDGHDYINQAIEKGAAKIYGTKNISGIDHYIQVEDINQTYTKLAQELYGYNDIKDKIKLIGITGTDGKTSTAYLINRILNLYTKSAYLGTSGFVIGNQEGEYLGLTTPFAEDFYRYVKESYELGCEYLVMEVSSHALEQQRLGNPSSINFAGIVFTNLTPEHLDFHHDMESYLQAKLKLLEYCNSDSVVVCNGDDYNFQPIAVNSEVDGFSLHQVNTKHQVEVIKSDLTGIEFKLDGQLIISNLIGEFNIYNLVSALLMINNLGFDITKQLEAIKTITVDGRMEQYQLPNGGLAIIDFAHTPDSIKKVLELVKEKCQGQVIVVNGCAGERDSSKRPTIGTIMDTYCDYIFLTTDDPRSEGTYNINQQIKQGITNLDKVVEEEDRALAIKEAISLCNNNDVVLLLGKGGQAVQYMQEGAVEYIEQQVLQKMIGEVYGR